MSCSRESDPRERPPVRDSRPHRRRASPHRVRAARAGPVETGGLFGRAGGRLRHVDRGNAGGATTRFSTSWVDGRHPGASSIGSITTGHSCCCRSASSRSSWRSTLGAGFLRELPDKEAPFYSVHLSWRSVLPKAVFGHRREGPPGPHNGHRDHVFPQRDPADAGCRPSHGADVRLGEPERWTPSLFRGPPLRIAIGAEDDRSSFPQPAPKMGFGDSLRVTGGPPKIDTF